jgi:hypothetical protein
MCLIFRRAKNDRQLTTFATQFTTTSPQKHHVLHPLFPKNPCKNKVPPAQRKKREKLPFPTWFQTQIRHWLNG